MVKRNDFRVKCHKLESQELQVNTLIIKGLKYLPYGSRIGMNHPRDIYFVIKTFVIKNMYLLTKLYYFFTKKKKKIF